MNPSSLTCLDGCNTWKQTIKRNKNVYIVKRNKNENKNFII